MALHSLWNNTTIPATPDVGSDNPGAVGLRFKSSVAGTVVGIKFYKPATNTGAHVGDLWTATGVNLATVTFSGETASGWQSMNFGTPVFIAPNTEYVVSLHSLAGHYSADHNAFDGAPFVNGPLSAVAGVPGATDITGNGRYVYDNEVAGRFPVHSFLNANYYVDVIFDDTDAGASGDYHLVASFTPSNDRQDFSGLVGGLFTASKNRIINQIGARRGPNASGVHQLEFGLWNAGALQPLFRASVDFGTGSVGQFVYVAIDPFALNAAEQYYLGMITVSGDGNQWSNTGAVTLNDATGVFSIYSDGSGHIVSSDTMYVGLDVAYLGTGGGTVVSAVGHADGVATVTGHGVARALSAGHAAGTATVAGTIKALARSAGTAAGVASVAGNTHALARSAGHAAGTATVAGITSTGQLAPAAGHADGHATVAGVGHAGARAAGHADGTASVAGVGHARFGAAGHADGHATIVGIGGALAAARGRAQGVGSVHGLTQGGSVANADGIASVWGDAASVFLFSPLGVTAPLTIADTNPFQLGLVRSSAAVDWWYGEDFQFQPKASGADVNAPAWNDPRRAPVQITAVLTFPYERGGQGRIAMKTQGKYNERPGHASLATRISFSVAALPYAPLRGDQLYRFADATTWQLAEIHRPDSVRIIADVTMVSTGSVAAVIGNARVAGQ